LFDYKVEDYDSGGTLLDSHTISDVIVNNDAWWLSSEVVDPFRIYVTNASYEVPRQYEDFMVLGSDYKESLTGLLLGTVGQVSIVTPEGSRDTMFENIKYLANDPNITYLRDPWGHVWAVTLGTPDEKFGNLGEVFTSVSFIEVQEA